MKNRPVIFPVIAVVIVIAATPPCRAAEPALPDHLPFIESPRPWGDSILPKPKPPARKLIVLPLGGLRSDQVIAMTCLQGLVNREQPRLWLMRGEDDRFWLDWHKSRKHIDDYEIARDWKAVRAQFAPLCKGAIVPDDKMYRGDLLAVNVAACEDCIVAPEALANELGLKIRTDLRGKFATYAQALDWLRTTYGKQLNHHLCDFREPLLLPHATFDYSFQWRAPMFWVAGPQEAKEHPGIDIPAEKLAVARLLSEMSPGGACLGFPAGVRGTGHGMGEPPGVELLSRYGQALICNNHESNCSVLSGVVINRLDQPKQPPAPKLERDKIYIALVLSDGDNQILWPHFMRRYFEHKDFGNFPLAFGMGPAIRLLQPGIAQWYFEHATPTTEFICDVSGAGYIQPDHFGAAFAEREKVWAPFLRHTASLMQSTRMKSIRTVGGGDEFLARYAKSLPFCHSLFADMGRYSGREGIATLTYRLPGGMPVFRAVTSWRYGKEGFLKEIREQVGKQRPAFINGFVHCWTFDMDAIDAIYNGRDADMVFVTPSQLAELYRRSLEP